MKAGKMGVQLQRRGTARKLRKAREKWIREKRCPECGQRFATRTALRAHILTATEAERPAAERG